MILGGPEEPPGLSEGERITNDCRGCGAQFPSSFPAADRAGWDWFTGDLRVIHCWCPHCIGGPAYVAAKARAGLP